MAKSILIIGAGIAGLAAGCYGQMSGYSTRIIEANDSSGGLCTARRRDGYTFDSCVQWLVGSGPGVPSFHRIWRELGVVPALPIINHREMMRIQGQVGKTLTVHTDIDRLEQHLKDLAPGDAALIHEFADHVRLFARYDPPVETPPELIGTIERVLGARKLLPMAKSWLLYGQTSIQTFAERFKSPFMREVFPLMFDVPDFPLLAVFGALAWMSKDGAGFPRGGSLALAQAIERRYRELGGEIEYRARVEKILVKKDRAVGVRLADGGEHRADHVIGAGDGYSTLFQLLEGRYVSDEIRDYYTRLPTFRPLVQVSLGVAMDFAGQPHALSFPLARPIAVAGQEYTRLRVNHYCFDPSLAPPGKTALVVMLECAYDYWRKLAEKRHESEKWRIAGTTIKQLERRFPGLTARVEVVDVATPRMGDPLDGWNGAYEGWLLTTHTLSLMMGQGMAKTLPGLKNFRMAGQWVEPGGGLSSVAKSGRHAIQLICHEDGQRFTAQVA